MKAHNPAHPFIAARDFLLAHRSDYERACQGFEWPRLKNFNWALDYFDVIAAGNDAPALWIVEENGDEEVCSFAQLSSRSSAIANWLQAKGVARGDHILLMMGNERCLWETMLAAIKLGAVVIPATTLLSQDDLADRFERGQVRHVIASAAHAQKFDGIPGDFTRIASDGAIDGWLRFEDSYSESEQFVPSQETQVTDPMLLYFTSGTTSKPKLVLHSHQSYPIGHLSTMYWIGLQPGDVHLNISSPGWAKHAWSCFFAPWNAQACVLIYNYTRFQAADLLEILQSRKVTSLCAPPTVYRLLMQHDLSRGNVHIRELIGAGEPMNPEVIERFQKAWGVTLRDGFGQTETTCQIGNSPGQVVKLGSMGRPLPGYRIELLDVDGKPTDEGEICIDLSHAPTGLMMGYADNPEHTTRVMQGGYYHTGDVASRDADGYITYVGRMDDVFKASDYRISPFELESILIEHPAVAEGAVIPSSDPVRLAVPKALVSLIPGQSPSGELAKEILGFCRDRLGPYKRIRKLEFLEELPKTISGKIRRSDLRRREESNAVSGNPARLEFDESA